jgi:hypothetical protein
MRQIEVYLAAPADHPDLLPDGDLILQRHIAVDLVHLLVCDLDDICLPADDADGELSDHQASSGSGSRCRLSRR